MKFRKQIMLIISCYVLVACEDFVDIDIPDNSLDSKAVFSKDETAINAVVGIYNELFRASFSGGFQSSVTVLSELSSDNLKVTFSTPNLLEFEENEIHPGNTNNLNLWSSAYNIIYMANAVIEGLNQYSGVSPEVKTQLIGEVKVLRAFTYFYLVNLYNQVPLVLAKDYRINNMTFQSSVEDVYAQIVNDLDEGIELLKPEIIDGERLRINQVTAMALMARVQLYLQNWEAAETWSSKVISSEGYFLEEDLNEVFLADSEEAIWQISPIGGGASSTNTNEGGLFIMLNQPANVQLRDDLISSFSSNDLRLKHWIGAFSSENDTYYFPYKYKIKIGTGEVPEYSMVLRLAEQYLIRSEALARQGKLEEAKKDLDILRARAELDLLSKNSQVSSQEAVLDQILEERRREFFTEWGHRWLDLKRLGISTETLQPMKPLWENTDVYYPIPEEEIRKNKNLNQNAGY